MSAEPLVAPRRPAWVRWSARLLVAAGFGYALYAIGALSRLHYTTVHGDFWIIYDRFFETPFPGTSVSAAGSRARAWPAGDSGRLEATAEAHAGGMDGSRARPVRRRRGGR